jgi:hypothetical protein
MSVFSHLLPALSHESCNLRLGGPGWALVVMRQVTDPVTGEESICNAIGRTPGGITSRGRPEEYPERVWQDFGRKLALGARLGHFFYHEDFLGQAPTTRFIQLAARSTGFMNLLQSFIDGSQSYSGLAARLYKTFGQALVEIATASIRNQLLALLAAGRKETRRSLAKGTRGTPGTGRKRQHVLTARQAERPSASSVAGAAEFACQLAEGYRAMLSALEKPRPLLPEPRLFNRLLMGARCLRGLCSQNLNNSLNAPNL